LGDLIGATCPFVMALDAVKLSDDLILIHALHQGANALQIAIATSNDGDILYGAIVIDVYSH